MHDMRIIGGKPLEGKIRVAGAKNAVLPILAATVLTDEPVVLRNVPNLFDVRTMLEILESVGYRCAFQNGQVTVQPGTLNTKNIPYQAVRKMRASFNILGPLAVRANEADVPLPGGCSIGVRPVDMHIEGLKLLGFEANIAHGVVQTRRRWKPNFVNIVLKFPSVGATEQLLSTAVLMNNINVVINNAALEPEVQELALFLQAMGASIEGIGTSTLRVQGVEKMHGVEYEIIPDRMEAGTYMMAAMVTSGELEIHGIRADHNESLLQKMRSIGSEVEIENGIALVRCRSRPRSSETFVQVYPGFPTDMQPQMTAVAAVSKGFSFISDSVFKTRHMHVPELQRMGAKIHIENGSIIVEGIPQLSGAPVRATDLRCAAALILAGLNADGETVVQEVDHVFRGYDQILEKLRSVGAEVEVVPSTNGNGKGPIG